jgi:hypothetical protein
VSPLTVGITVLVLLSVRRFKAQNCIKYVPLQSWHVGALGLQSMLEGNAL